MKFLPAGKRILIKKDPRKEVSEGGIIPSQPVKDNSHRGTVVAVGEDVEPFSVGDIVFWWPYHSIIVTVDGEYLHVIESKDILGKEEK